MEASAKANRGRAVKEIQRTCCRWATSVCAPWCIINLKKCLNFIVCGWGQCVYCQVVNYLCHHVSVRIPERASNTESPPAVVVYVHIETERTGLFSISARLFDCRAPNGSLVEHLGLWQKMEPLTHRVICRCDTWDFEASCHRSKI